MKEKIAKTNVARLLDKARIAYELIPYEVDENDLSAIHVAASLGENIEQVFKTLVLHGDKSGYFVCVIPGEHEVDLKMAAKVSGNKKCDLIPMKELLPLTGYIRGGCSPIGMKKHFPTYIHETCTAFPYIYISAGIRGLQIKIAADDLIKETKAEICSLFTEYRRTLWLLHHACYFHSLPASEIRLYSRHNVNDFCQFPGRSVFHAAYRRYPGR